MANKLKIHILYFLSIVIFFAGCSRTREMLPNVELPISEMNQYIELVPNPGGGAAPLKNGNFYDFQIRNLSDQVVIFPGDYGVKLFIKNEANDWKEVENSLGYPENEKILPLDNKYPLGRIVAIIPYILDLSEVVTLRVVVIGHFKDKPNEIVGAFTDIILNP